MSASASTALCDTIPAAKLATSSEPIVTHNEEPYSEEIVDSDLHSEPDSAPLASPRKLCVRHQRMADEGTNLKLQQVGFQSHSSF